VTFGCRERIWLNFAAIALRFPIAALVEVFRILVLHIIGENANYSLEKCEYLVNAPQKMA
jgi:hypothetical protein